MIRDSSIVREKSPAPYQPHSPAAPKTEDGQLTIDTLDFEPIKGYPMLQWRGKRPFTSTQFYPAQLKEQHGQAVNGWLNKIYWGDNLQVMSHLLKHYRGKVNLVYIDPPFDSKADYRKKIKLRGSKVEGDINAFEEKQYTDIWANDEYLQFMYERIILLRELLHDSGSIVLHCDCSQGHNLRCILDEVMGASNFVNEIIWDYRRWPTPAPEFQKMHDNLYIYAKRKGCLTFNRQYMARTESTEKRWKGQAIVAAHDATGARVPSDYGDSTSQGSPLNDVWYVPIVAPSGNERTGYPTQKPVALLRKVITSLTNPHDLVLDCFMGSGTAQVAALRQGRRFLGADINLGAIQIATRRLNKHGAELRGEFSEKETGTLELDDEPCEEVAETQNKDFYTGFEVFNVNNYDVFRNPAEAKEYLIEALELQCLPAGHLFDGEKEGRMWKVMSVNKIAYQALVQRIQDNPNQPAEKITLVCMGHEPDLAAVLNQEVAHGLAVKAGTKTPLDVQALDILRDRGDLQFKRDAEAKVVRHDDCCISIEAFYPMNLLAKLSLEKEKVADWREMVDSVMIDWNYDGAIFTPTLVDIPEKNGLVSGKYQIPDDAGTIRVKITDVLSESIEVEVKA
jgi:DNA modification methylase